MNWLQQIAPTIATALGGPLAGMAVEAIGNALGMSDATKESITDVLKSGTMTAEQTAALASDGVYDIEIINDAGEVSRLIQGNFTLNREVTR